ncbi:UDP-N-acetylmuramate--L-alanine ligase [Defluviitalea raffinosedens]|uniref:UDP-N-acetylmuramate--L-alanine ligase n=1 Tax=Defluviitalea raffinosedens TaxID=1450156 RepID=A0A7C8LEB1_9FIRM|nr:UDP-N-acetylmuramate--L-alanine ligase [Defluviitalea raffinosedens]KAE9636193.1 UDP-N-acetylmuramate--L-alanine ligase [Defluviitalea raffinosedens]
MLDINFENTHQKIHFIGIGGISMSGLAEILVKKGFKVSGSDMKNSKIIRHLEQLGVDFHLGHLPSNIKDDLDFVVYTAAIKEDNPELMEARKRNIPTMDRAELLGQIMKNYPYAIAVSGTHGKTTTTSMLSHILLEAKKDPTISVGGILDAIGGNIRTGHSDYFITEACEYYDSFLKFYPYIGIILNIEEDHLDYFKDIDHIRNSFTAFAKRIPKEGTLVINGDIENIHSILDEVDCKVVTFGTDPSRVMWTAANISYNEKACGSFDLFYQGKNMGRISLGVPGIHNIYNALAACACAHALNISTEDMANGLKKFIGTHQRFEIKGNLKGITIVDDYAHHPTEIKATLAVANHYPHNRLWCVFQPHTYSRTKAFLKEFAEALTAADHIILTDIYAAREKDLGEVHSKDLQKELEKLGKKSYYFSDFESIENFLLENCIPGDLLITMGAGDVSIIGEDLLGANLSTLSTELSTDSQMISCE